MAPSLLASDFARLAEEIRKVESAGADWLHVDVMDGHFVPNLTIGPPVVSAIRAVSTKPLDVHLMIQDPWRYADAFLDAGAATLTFHIEVAREDSKRNLELIDQIRGRGARAGLAINPDGDVCWLEPYLPQLDLVLVMSVFPGFGGQKFMPEVLAGVRRLREEFGYDGDIEMDGGIDAATIGACAAAGTNVFVSGTGVFGAPDWAARIAELRAAARTAS